MENKVSPAKTSTMKLIMRKGPLVVLQDLQGRYWLTRRKKLRRDSRRRMNRTACRVVFRPLLQIKEEELGLFLQRQKY